MIGIYKLTSPSGKSYIGQSKNIERRLTSYRNLKCKKQQALYNSIFKYGFKNFKVEILEECNEEMLNELEVKYITEFKTLSPNGYNLKEGGLIKKFTEEAKTNCKRGKIREWKNYIHTYDEPLLLFNSKFELLKKYLNLEEAALDNKIDPRNIFYSSFCVYKDNEKIWILSNAKNIENVFGNVECTLYDIYEYQYKDNIIEINKIINKTNE